MTPTEGRALPTRRCVNVLLAAAATIAIWASTVVAAPGAPAAQEATELFRFQDPAIRESSGVAVSSRRDDVIFTHNDSGDRPRFFAIDGEGCTLARYTLAGAEAIDWEDMTRGPERRGKPTLWFGDIGDNAAARAGIAVYRVAEPEVRSPNRDTAATGCSAPAERDIAATRFELQYADGPHDAETLLVHPRTGRLFVVTKDLSGAPAALYAAPRKLREGAVIQLQRVAAVSPGAVTAGDVSPDGRRLVLRTYTDAFEWRIPDRDLEGALTSAPTRSALPPTPQGEAIAYTRTGKAVITTSEDPGGTGPPVYRIRLAEA
jgi:hypothetical protein